MYQHISNSFTFDYLHSSVYQNISNVFTYLVTYCVSIGVYALSAGRVFLSPRRISALSELKVKGQECYRAIPCTQNIAHISTVAAR